MVILETKPGGARERGNHQPRQVLWVSQTRWGVTGVHWEGARGPNWSCSEEGWGGMPPQGMSGTTVFIFNSMRDIVIFLFYKWENWGTREGWTQLDWKSDSLLAPEDMPFKAWCAWNLKALKSPGAVESREKPAGILGQQSLGKGDKRRTENMTSHPTPSAAASNSS